MHCDKPIRDWLLLSEKVHFARNRNFQPLATAKALINKTCHNNGCIAMQLLAAKKNSQEKGGRRMGKRCLSARVLHGQLTVNSVTSLALLSTWWMNYEARARHQTDCHCKSGHVRLCPAVDRLMGTTSHVGRPKGAKMACLQHWLQN